MDDRGHPGADAGYRPGMFVQRAGAVVAVVVSLSGCGGGEPAATALRPVSPVASAAAPTAAVASPVPVPSAAQAETPEGAAEFARFFYAEVERAYEALDPAIVSQLSAPACEACAKFVRTLTITRERGERYVGVAYDLALAEAPADDAPRTVVTIVYDAPPVVLYASDGSVISREPGLQGVEEELELVRGGGSWLVQDVRAA